jgi:hypothetical protein
MFEVHLGGRPSSPQTVFPNWLANDRFGIVIDEPFGGLGATHLIQMAVTMFYDAKPSRRANRKVYPEIYALHYGRGFGAHAPFDFWPARREAILERDHRILLDAINDRGITRLAVPERPKRDIEHRPKEVDAALDRIVSAILYSPTGQVDTPDFSVRGNDQRTEFNPKQVLRLAQGYPQQAVLGAGSSASIKETDTSYYEWIESRRFDTTAQERDCAQLRRKALQDEWSCPASVDSFSSSLFDPLSINLTPQTRSAAAGGRSSELIFSYLRQKSTAYKAPGAVISFGPWLRYPRQMGVATG